MTRAVQWMERHQVALYLLAILVGALGGLVAPAFTPALAIAITPALGLLMFATFLGVPLIEVGRAFRDVRLLIVLVVVNFVVAPILVFVLSRLVAGEPALVLGLLLVLLTPCVDYVLVFTGIAGGARERLLAATPMLMVLQILLLPLYLFAFAGPTALAGIDLRPFIEAFLLLIVIPLATAAIVQVLARRYRFGRIIASGMHAAMVPLMVTTLVVVVASQIPGVVARLGSLLVLVPIYVVFLVGMVAVGLWAGRVAGMDARGIRAVVFSGATRNSLVVLPLALALPPALALAPLAVVTQTLVELIGMVVLTRVVPRLVPGGAPEHGKGPAA